MWRPTLPAHPRRTGRIRARRPGFERLEGRAMLAGNVTTGFLGQALLVTGDAADNTIEVNQDGLDPGRYRIVGLAGTTVDGRAEVVVTARKDLHIDLGDGSDGAILEAVSVARDTRITDTEGVQVVLSDIGRDLTVATGEATGGSNSIANQVTIQDTEVGRDLKVTTGDATGATVGNLVRVAGTDVGRDLTVATGDATSAFFGNPVRIADTTVGRDLTVTTGDATSGAFGNSVRIEGNTTIGRDLTVATGDATSASIGNEVIIEGAIIGRRVTAATGDSTGASFGNEVIFEGGTIGGDLTVTTGDATGAFVGNLVQLLDLSVRGEAAVTTGAGNDLVALAGSAFLATALFNGGPGTDTFDDLGGNTFAVRPVIINFETVT